MIVDELRPRTFDIAIWRVNCHAEGVYFAAARLSDLPSCSNGQRYCPCRWADLKPSFISSMN